MNKLLASFTIVVLLTVPAYKANATTVTLTNDIEMPGKPAPTGSNPLTEYDLTTEAVTFFPYKGLFTRKKFLDVVYASDNNHTIPPNILYATSSGLTSNSNDLTEHNPITEIAILIFEESRLPVNYILNVAYVRDNNDLIPLTTSGAILGSTILEDRGFPEYNPIPDGAKLPPGKYCYGVNNMLDIVYIRGNDNTIQPTTSGVTLNSPIAENTDPTNYNPITNTTKLFFNEDLPIASHIIDVVDIFGNDSILSSVVQGATLESLNFENICVIYTTTNNIAIPEPTSTVVLSLGSLFWFRKYKSNRNNHQFSKSRFTRMK